ncbi:MAG: hypothetical protein PHS15_04860 [Clostridiaceae bacterium]|nr:hypothetical protein [Clostridiaceae bacterium]
MTRRLFIIFLAAVIAFAGMPLLNADVEVNGDILIKYDVEESRLFKNSKFTLTLLFLM